MLDLLITLLIRIEIDNIFKSVETKDGIKLVTCDDNDIYIDIIGDIKFLTRQLIKSEKTKESNIQCLERFGYKVIYDDDLSYITTKKGIITFYNN